MAQCRVAAGLAIEHSIHFECSRVVTSNMGVFLRDWRHNVETLGVYSQTQIHRWYV